MKQILILGGAGELGRRLARRLVTRFASVSVVLAGRRSEPLEGVAKALCAEAPDRVRTRLVDAADPKSVARALSDIDLLVTAAPIAAHVDTIASACVEVGVDAVDSHADPRAWAAWRDHRLALQRVGRRCIAQAGLHPGLSPPVVRAAAAGFDAGARLVIAMAMYERNTSTSSLLEIVDIMGTSELKTYENGRWGDAGWSFPQIEFGPRMGRRTCFPLFLDELEGLPEDLRLGSLAAYIAGYNWFSDYLVSPVVPLLYRLRPGLGRAAAARTIAWTLRRFRPVKRDGCEVVAEAEGTVDGRPARARILIGADDTWGLTATALLACVEQIHEGRVAPGVHRMGDTVPPEPLLDLLSSEGVDVRVTRSRPQEKASA